MKRRRCWDRRRHNWRHSPFGCLLSSLLGRLLSCLLSRLLTCLLSRLLGHLLGLMLDSMDRIFCNRYRLVSCHMFCPNMQAHIGTNCSRHVQALGRGTYCWRICMPWKEGLTAAVDSAWCSAEARGCRAGARLLGLWARVVARGQSVTPVGGREPAREIEH